MEKNSFARDLEDFYVLAFEDTEHRIIQQIVNDYQFYVVHRKDMTREEFIEQVTGVLERDKKTLRAFKERFGLAV